MSQLMTLPDEIVVDIIAHIPRCDYPILSLVSRRFRSIVASPAIYTRRSLLGCRQHCLYVLLFDIPKCESRWHILRRKPNNSRLVLVPSLPPMPLAGGFVPVGSRIYVVNGDTEFVRTWSVLSIDCTSHTVHTIPDTPKRFDNIFAADVIDGKIYVIGDCDSVKSIMVLDTQTQMWEREVTKPEAELGPVSTGCVVMAGKMYMREYKGSFVYEPKEGKWEMDGTLNSKGWDSACVLDGMLYYYHDIENKLRVYDLKKKSWGVVKGVERLLPEPILWMPSQTVSYGDNKLVVVLRGSNSEIWCAEIVLNRRQGGEIWGEVEWCDVVATEDTLCPIKSLAVMV